MTEIERDNDTITVQFTYEEFAALFQLLILGTGMTASERDMLFDSLYHVLFYGKGGE